MTTTRFPMQPYPTSWYRVLQSDDLKPGEVRGVRYFGRELALFRDESGTVSALDAQCPHLGANLAVGGRVEEGGLRCPFHGWRFSGTGECLHIPYSDRVPARARARSYPVRELNGVVAVFHDDLGRDPDWDVPAIADYDDEIGWGPRAWKTWRIRTHVQEIFENGPDWAHQKTLHCSLDFPTATCEADGVRFRGSFSGTYDAGEGLPIREVYQTTHYEDIGLGFTHLSMRLDYAGLVVDREIQFCLTPIDDEYVDATLSTRTKSLGNEEATLAISEATAFHTWRSFEEDIPIWENKIYRALPARVEHNRGEEPAVLCAGDAGIAQLRQWARQFYTDDVCAV